MLAVLLSLLVFVGVYLAKKHFRQLQLSAKIRGPPGFPLIGNGLDLLYKSPIEFVEIISSYFKNYGKFFRLWLGNQLVFVISDPKDVEAVLTSTKLITKSSEYDFLKPWLNTGLLTSTGRKWISRRKIITPAFHFNILEDFVEIFDRQSAILVKKLKAFQGRGEFNIFPLTALCALDVICESAMGISLDSQSGQDSEYVKNVNELADIIHRRTYDFILRYDVLFKFTPTYRRQQQLIKKLHVFTDKVIVSRREKLQGGGLKAEDARRKSSGDKKKIALLDLLLLSSVDGKPLTNEDIREEIDTFMFEGHDTTNSAITFMLFNIAKYQEVQRKCYNEVLNVIGEDLEKPVDMKTLNEMKYLELVIKESLRLYPSVPLLGRHISEEIEINGKLLPKDASIIITPYFMARDPDIFEDPLKFIPERFDVETTADKMNPYSYIPFSAGSRNCVGQKFAMLEIKSTVSKILRHFHIGLENGFEPQDSLELVIKSQNGIMIKLEPRSH